MAAIKFEAEIDESKAGVFPELRPLLGQNVLLVAVAAEDQPSSVQDDAGRITLEEFLRDHQMVRPEEVPPVSLEDMERAIGLGAVGGDV